jgi:hypothetical protein
VPNECRHYKNGLRFNTESQEVVLSEWTGGNRTGEFVIASFFRCQHVRLVALASLLKQMSSLQRTRQYSFTGTGKL